MLLKDFIPAKDVQEFVQFYRIVHLQFGKAAVIPFKAYPPRPEQCLAFYPYDTETIEYTRRKKTISNLPVVLYGQFAEVTNRYIGNNFLVFQVIFNPGALYRLTGTPSDKLTNEYLNASDIFSMEVNLVNEQLYHATDYLQMIEIVNQFMRRLIKKQQKPTQLIDQACLMLLKTDAVLSLSELAKQAYLSNKQLERVFKQRTGVNPKLFARIIQFDKAFRLKNSNPSCDWLKIAIECNYYDYQHLSKAYKDFTGLSPTAFHEVEDKAPEREFGLSETYYNP